jgi:hypothetical protein
LYAVHIPPQSLEKQRVGGEVFARFVMGGPDKNMQEAGQLHVFVNGKNRPEVEEEARAIRFILKNPVTKIYRIMQHLGVSSGGLNADSVSIIVRRMAGMRLRMTYKHVPDDQWFAAGREKTGIYDAQYEESFGKATLPKDVVSGWHGVDNTTCTILKIK